MLLVLALVSGAAASEQRFMVVVEPGAGDEVFREAIAQLSEQVLAGHVDGRIEVPDASLAHLNIAAGRHHQSIDAISQVMRKLVGQGEAARAQRWVPYLLHAQAAEREPTDFDAAYGSVFRAYFSDLDDLAAHQTQFWFTADAGRAEAELRQFVAETPSVDGFSLADVFSLARRQAFVTVFGSSSQAAALILADQEDRYLIEGDVLIQTPDDITLSAVVVRSRRALEQLPTAMMFTIYTDPAANRVAALQAAAHGYVGVVVDARGKRLSTDDIAPYEHDADDATAAIDWISRQAWSDGRVAMYGGSYSGFAAWAATKRMHPALRTIVPYVAAIPGLGLPMENNVFLNANYAWPFFVTNNRFLDHDTYFQRGRWSSLPEEWFVSGRPYREIDEVDGTPNPWLQRWLSHPSYDAYWQEMVPYGEDFAHVDIPVLSITGYYDDGQVSALHYFKEHHRHHPDARHYLLIGPYDHFGAQSAIKPGTVNGYDVDPSAQFDTPGITFQWLDHVLRDGPLPELLRQKVNYQLMGADEWRHAPSLQAAADSTTFRLSPATCGPYHCLSRELVEGEPLVQTVDLGDRTTEGHRYYPYPAVRDGLEVQSGFAFVSEPFKTRVQVVGMFSGELKVRIDKRDFDFSVSLYELMPEGQVMQLSYYVGRASYSRDMTRRKLLVPGEWARVPFERTRMTGRLMEAGSRLLVVVDVLKDAGHQVNMGTGKDVSDESTADAEMSLKIEWHPDSIIRVPLREEP